MPRNLSEIFTLCLLVRIDLRRVLITPLAALRCVKGDGGVQTCVTADATRDEIDDARLLRGGLLRGAR